MDLLRCENLSKSFDGVRALDNISIEFAQSGTTAIIGPNGAGKTSLINVLTGFLRPDSGKCFLGEREITHLSSHRIAQLGIARTFQDLRLILQLSAVENVMLARPNQRGERLGGALFGFGVSSDEAHNREVAAQLLEFVGLNEYASQPARELSYGQQKLLTLACCLATDAEVLFLDEPVAGVHPAMASQILEKLKQLRAQERVTIFIEHDIAAVRQAADIVIVMDRGKIIAEGVPSEILDRPEIMEAYVT